MNLNVTKSLVTVIFNDLTLPPFVSKSIGEYKSIMSKKHNWKNLWSLSEECFRKPFSRFE